MSDNTSLTAVVCTLILAITSCILTCIVYDEPLSCADWADGTSESPRDGAEFRERLAACLHERGIPPQTPEAP